MNPSPSNGGSLGSTVADIPRVHPAIPNHELLRRIGEGSYGEVWLARTVMGRYRAVKIVYRRSFEDERPYEREFKGILRFEPISRAHDGHVDILHVGRDDQAGNFFYVMELADDLHTGQDIKPEIYCPKTLKSLHAHRGRLTFAETLQIGLNLTAALDHMHRQNLVHRDIKPSNIVFIRGAPKLADIGLVTDIGEARSFVGTEGFIPPEGPGSVQADLYSLGKVLYEVSLAQKEKAFPDLPDNFEELSDKQHLLELNEVILKACESDLRIRYKSAGDMHGDLLLLQGGKSVKRLRLVERRLALLTRAGILVTCVAVLATGLVFQIGHQKKVTIQRLVRSHVDAGSRLMNEGDLFGALLWYAEALRLDAGDIRLEENHRIRIASVLRQCPKLVSVFAHEGPVNDGAFSPDGHHLATASDDHTAAVWDLVTGERRFVLDHKSPVYHALYSADGKRIVTADGDHLAHVWDATTGRRLIARLKHKHSGVLGISPCFSPDSERLVTLTESNIAQIWDTTTGEPVGEPLRHDQPISSVAFSPTGLQIVSTTDSNDVWLWDAITGKSLPVKLNHEAPVGDACLSPDGKTCATASDDCCARLWDLARGEFLPPVMQHHHWVNHVRFSPNGDRLLTTSWDKTAQIWDVATQKPLIPPLLHGYRVSSGVFTPDGRRVVTASGEIYSRVWNAKTGEPVSPPLKHLGTIKRTNVSPDGRRIITVTRDQTVRVWDQANGEPVVLAIRPVAHRSEPFSPNGQLKVTFGEDNTARIMELVSGRPLNQSLKHTSPLRQAVFSPDSKLLVTETIDAKVTIWDLATGEVLSPPLRTKYVAGAHGAGAHGASPRMPTKDELQRDLRPTRDLLQLAELMSGNRIDQWGGLVPLEMNEVTNLWVTLRQNSPTNFSTSREERFAWHDREAKSCESDWNWWAARFHLNHLLETKPADQTLQARRAYAEMALDRENNFTALQCAKGMAIPPRNPLAARGPIDLSDYYNVSLKEDQGATAEIRNSLADLPSGLQIFDGVPFDVRGVIQLSSQKVKHRPSQIAGIKVGQKCRRVHFLHATGFGGKDGTQVGSYIVHYADGQEKAISIVYGRDVRNWWIVPGEPIEAENSVVVWMGMNPVVEANGKFLRIFGSTWENPFGSQEIVCIDFLSSMADPAPFLIALTVE
jgi:WD40 repeat protein